MTDQQLPATESAREALERQMRGSDAIEGFEPDEHLICVIHKHPFGLITLYIGAVVGIFGAFALVYFLLPQVIGEDQLKNAQSFVGIALIMASVLVMLGLLVATYVYNKSVLIISDKHVTQIIQRSLFNREVSELSMSNVEDVAAEKKGIIPTIFDYGRLRIQTAGALDNFLFTYCPRPNHHGKVILDARQAYAESLRETDNR